MESLFVPIGLVALAEVGDKTQLLALLLAARFKKPWTIMGGIVVATLINHAMAGAVGAWILTHAPATLLRWVLGLGFVAMGVWTLIPDHIEDEDNAARSRYGVFGTTVISFFLAEMGDKTQIATVALAARYPDPILVVIGTTLGMLLANGPVVLLGDRMAGRVPVRLVHGVAAAVFVLLGLATLLGAMSLTSI